MKFVPLKRKHLKALGQKIKYGNFAFAALRSGVAVAIGGINEQWPGRGYAWFYSKSLTPREWAEVTRRIRSGLTEADYRRIEIAVVDEKGRRWAEKLGFREEYRARKFTPEGKDAWLYAIVR